MGVSLFSPHWNYRKNSGCRCSLLLLKTSDGASDSSGAPLYSNWWWPWGLAYLIGLLWHSTGLTRQLMRLYLVMRSSKRRLEMRVSSISLPINRSTPFNLFPPFVWLPRWHFVASRGFKHTSYIHIPPVSYDRLALLHCCSRCRCRNILWQAVQHGLRTPSKTSKRWSRHQVVWFRWISAFWMFMET